MESLTVNTFVKDIDKSIEFYKMLGFEVVMSVPEQGGPLVWVMMNSGGVTIMLQSMQSLGEELPDVDRNKTGGSLLFYIKIKNIRSYFEEIKDQIEVVKELHKTFYGATEFTIKDCDGFYLTFAEDEV